MGVMWLDIRAIDEIVADVRRWGRRVETGGPLFGFEAQEDVVVACAAGTGDTTVRTSSRFEPNADVVDKLIAETHAISDARYRYIGSWHTHPGGGPAPSRRDRDTAHDIATDAAIRLRAPVLLIVATSRIPLRRTVRRFGAWRWMPDSCRLDELAIDQCVLSERLCHH